MRIADLETTGKQQNGTPASTVAQILAANADHPGADVRASIQDALDVGMIVREDSGGFRVSGDVSTLNVTKFEPVQAQAEGGFDTPSSKYRCAD